jgi:hypothetical protein
MTEKTFRKSLISVGLVALLSSAVALPVMADDWRDRDHERHEEEWREHERHDREWREHEWREHHYEAPPVYYSQPGYAVVAPPILSVPSGINIVVPLRIR